MTVALNLTWLRRRLRFASLAVIAMLTSCEANAQGSISPESSSIIRITSTAELPMTRNLVLGLGRAVIFELPVDAQDTVISDPGKLDAVVLTPRRVMLFAKSAGTSNVFIMGRDGRRLLILDISVRRDYTELSKMLQQVLPGSKIRVQASGTGIVLTGTVANGTDAQRAAEIAEQYLANAGTGTAVALAGGTPAVETTTDKPKVINLITTGAKEQVMLKVTVAELQRDALKRVGVNMPEALIKAGSFTFSKVMTNGFPITGPIAPVTGSALAARAQWDGNSATGVLEAFERAGLARTLAEPTLIAMSGEPAKFHAGGEMPVPISQDNNKISVTFKPFGVSLAFTPYVLSEGRISLRVSAEVSELSSQGAVTTGVITIQGIQVRKAETVVEMPSGSSLAMAGMLSDQTRRNTDGVPELQNLPVLGALFRSKDYRSSQSELVIIVTPYVVRPTEPGQLSRPNDGKMPVVPVTPLREMLSGHLTRVYSHLPGGRVRGGYIVEQPGLKD
jgi:pilus assembly protein CpaC